MEHACGSASEFNKFWKNYVRDYELYFELSASEWDMLEREAPESNKHYMKNDELNDIE